MSSNTLNRFYSKPKAGPIAHPERQFFHGLESREALRIITRLRDAGFVALLAGGCVRDALLGKQPKDYDVATDATPDSVREVFGKKHTLAFGESFGVIGVLPDRNGSDRNKANRNKPIEPTEVATFRSDGRYSDGRRPDSVSFGNARQDALRRDFTINGLFYDPFTDEVIDHVGGQVDLKAGLLRTIGDPELRFGEDKLRMLRAVRFATTLGFRIDPSTSAAIRLHADQMAVVSGERIGAEMRRVLTSSSAIDGLASLIQTGLSDVVLPEIGGLDLPQLGLALSHSGSNSFPVTLACLLLPGDAPAHALRAIMRRWKLSNDEVRQVSSAISHWKTIAGADKLAWSVVQPVLIDRDAQTVVAVAQSQVRAEGQSDAGIEIARRALAMPREQLDPPPLLSGDDLRQLGIPAGPRYRQILQAIRDDQLDQKILDRDAAIERARLG